MKKTKEVKAWAGRWRDDKTLIGEPPVLYRSREDARREVFIPRAVEIIRVSIVPVPKKRKRK